MCLKYLKIIFSKKTFYLAFYMEITDYWRLTLTQPFSDLVFRIKFENHRIIILSYSNAG